MLSFGIEYERAFSIAFWSARFPDGSPPPSFAATMIARESFEKSLPRFASAAPFLCLIEDHLLCPDTRLLSHSVQEHLVDASVVGQLRMERGNEQPPLAREHRVTVDLGQHLDVRADVLEPWSADEHRTQRLVAVADVEIRLEARDLAPERVAPHAEVAEREVVAVEDNHPGARPEDRLREIPERLVEPVEPHQPHERRGLAAGDDEPVESLDLLGLANLDDVRAQPAQHRRVLAEVSLDGEDADRRTIAHASDCRGARAAARAASRLGSTVRIIRNRAVSNRRTTAEGVSSVSRMTRRRSAAVARWSATSSAPADVESTNAVSRRSTTMLRPPSSSSESVCESARDVYCSCSPRSATTATSGPSWETAMPNPPESTPHPQRQSGRNGYGCEGTTSRASRAARSDRASPSRFRPSAHRARR